MHLGNGKSPVHSVIELLMAQEEQFVSFGKKYIMRLHCTYVFFLTIAHHERSTPKRLVVIVYVANIYERWRRDLQKKGNYNKHYKWNSSID